MGDSVTLGARRRTVVLGLAALLAGATATVARATCTSLKGGPIVYDVASCVAVSPEQTFDTTKEQFQWIAGLDDAGRKQFFDKYRGLYLKGRVIKSKAIEKGLQTESGVLFGEEIAAFVPPGGGTCAQMTGKRLGANLHEICCDGGGDAPCLLGTSYELQNVQALGAVSSSAGDAGRQAAHASKDAAAGNQAMKDKKYKVAAAAYERARTNGALDNTGLYRLGLAYHELDQCGDAIAPLRIVHSRHEKRQIMADEEPAARAASFLLARCYARVGAAGDAVLILNSYLLEPKKYAKEVRDSIGNADFGYIHTSKEYDEYRKAAQKALGKSKP